MKEDSFLDARISVAANGWGMGLDVSNAVRLRKLNPIAVWEMKMCAEENKAYQLYDGRVRLEH